MYTDSAMSYFMQAFAEEVIKLAADPIETVTKSVDPRKAPKFSPKKREDSNRKQQIAVGAAAASPFVGMIGQGKIKHDPIRNKSIKSFSSMADLEDAAKPGDILVTSKKKSTWKTFQSPFSGSEFYHAQVVADRTRPGGMPGAWNQATTVSIEDPHEEKAFRGKSRDEIRKGLDTVGDTMKGKKGYGTLMLLRPSKELTPAQVKTFVEEAMDRSRQEYGGARAVKAWAKDIFLPKGRISELLNKPHQVKYETIKGKKVPVVCSGDVCSTMPAAAYEKATGRKLVPGQGAGGVMPADLLRTNELKPVGAFGDRKYKLRKYGPLGSRAALGLGLAGTTAAVTEDPAAVAGVGGAVAGAEGAAALAGRGHGKQIAALEAKMKNAKGPGAAAALAKKIEKLEALQEAAAPTLRSVVEQRSSGAKGAGQTAKRYAKTRLAGKAGGAVAGYMTAKALASKIRGSKSKASSEKKS